MEENKNVQSLDLSYLIALVGDDPKSLLEVFSTFIDRTPCYLKEIEEAAAVENWDRVADFAHKIKPVFGYLGRKDLSDFVRTIEQDANRKSAQVHIPSKIHSLKAQVDQVFKQLWEMKLALEKAHSDA